MPATQIVSTLLIAGVVLLYSFQTLFCVKYTKNYAGREDLASPVFSILEGISIVFVTLCFTGFKFAPSGITWLIGIANVVAIYGYNASMIKAGAKGSYAFLNVCMLFGGILIPLVVNVIFWNGTITLVQIGAVAAMLVSFVLMNIEDIRLSGTPKIYYLYVFFLFLCNGLYGVFLKLQSLTIEAESLQMVIICFGGMAVVSFVQLFIKEKKGALAAFKMGKKAVLPLIVCLISAALAINGIMYVMPFVDITMLYTVDNGGVMVLSAIYSFAFFHEKLTPCKVVGLICAIGSIFALSI